MNDRELLELAAKAAGIVTHWGDGWQSDMMFRSAPRPNSPLVTNIEWNPLTDDGDALRLAVNLEIDIEFGLPMGSVRCVYPLEPIEVPDNVEELGDDPYAATRRAIVRAAAEIGKAMP